MVVVVLGLLKGQLHRTRGPLHLADQLAQVGGLETRLERMLEQGPGDRP